MPPILYVDEFIRAARILTICFALSWLCGTACAQDSPKYLTNKLKEMAVLLSHDYNLDCSYPQVSRLKGKDIIVTCNSFQTIDHIGFKLFNRFIIEQSPSPVYSFVERFLLELFLIKDPAKISQYLSTNKVVLRSGQYTNREALANLLNALPKLDNEPSIIITTDNNRYSISWMQKSKVLFSIYFPIQYELLWGMNKIEAENSFYMNLLTYQEMDGLKRDTVSSANSLVALNDSCYRAEGSYYGIDEMTSDQFYRKLSPDVYVPLNDANYPIESISNLFTIGSATAIRANVTQRMYGGRKNAFDIPLTRLLDFCKASGCEAYVGIESQTDNQLTGAVLLVNHSLGYNHLLSFKTDIRILTKPERYAMDVQLFAFVPIHNIKNLYEGQTIKRNRR